MPKGGLGGSDSTRDGEIYTWDVAEIGDESPPYVYEITPEKIADYCKAVRYENPIYINDAAAKELGFTGVFAPPTMIYIYAPQRRVDVMRAKGYIAPEQSEQSPRSTLFVSTEVHFQGVLVFPGDVITSTTKVVDKIKRRGDKLISFRVTARNDREEKVVEYDYVCLWETASRVVRQNRPSQRGSRPGKP